MYEKRVKSQSLITAFILIFFSFMAAPFHLATAQDLTPPEKTTEEALRILEEVDDMWRGKSAHGTFSMKVKTANYARSMRMEFWSKGKDKSLVRIMSPLKEKGTATLKSGASIYTYLPKTDRTIRLTSGMMMGSWMGSHFTNDDLVKESRISEDYDAEITFEGQRNGDNIIEFTLIPKPDAAVVWGKIVLTVQRETHIPIVEIYYDEDMQVVRKMQFGGVKEMGGRRLASIMKVVPEDKPGEFTELVYDDIAFDIGLNDSFFSIASLRRK